MLTWKTETDDDANTLYDAESGLFDDPAIFPDADTTPLHWVVAPKLSGNVVVWTIDTTDTELVIGAEGERGFHSAKAAKLWCEKREAELLAKGATT